AVFLNSSRIFSNPSGCVPREFPDGVVCVCNSTHCDDIEPLEGFIAPGTAVVYRTSLQGARMDKSSVKQTPKPSVFTAELDASTVFQEILGFGGAFTDSTGINLNSLRKQTQDLLMQQYFGPSGSEYTLGRVPIAATDFSLRIYTYDDGFGEDFNMEHFALANDDFQFKIPYIKQAIDLQKSNGGLKLIGAPWTPPFWMKTDDTFKGGAMLKGEQDGPYYASYAQYFVKFFESYLVESIPFWGVTIQNEAADWHTIFPTATYARNFIKNHLSPALRNSEAAKNLKIMGLDDQRVYLPQWTDEFAEDKEALSVLDGISIHWYADHQQPASVLTDVHDKHPEKFLLYTEACNGSPTSGTKGVSLGNYTSGESYAHSIIENLNNWVSGWMDWNMALNTQGGYSWFMNFVDSPIIVETNKNEFFKQPMYYVMAHFSKFLKPGSRVINLNLPPLPEKVEALGAIMVDGKRYVTILNRNDVENVTVSLHEKGVDKVYTTVSVPAHSLVTVIWTKY
ncbi:hypothetical protein PFISCL1PPCAC_15950, partial [Pristionchus fissidentatus]